ncbi:MAG: DNA-binding protein [Candidatus Cloacimonetes bacterium]|nr:DNA-binding protein [Candidatus Cloacimonadota bacterium]
MLHSPEFLTPSELVKRWKNVISEKTLANWRSQHLGPTYKKLGGKIVYLIDDITEYERLRTIKNDTSK